MLCAPERTDATVLPVCGTHHMWRTHGCELCSIALLRKSNATGATCTAAYSAPEFAKGFSTGFISTNPSETFRRVDQASNVAAPCSAAPSTNHILGNPRPAISAGLCAVGVSRITGAPPPAPRGAMEDDSKLESSDEDGTRVSSSWPGMYEADAENNPSLGSTLEVAGDGCLDASFCVFAFVSSFAFLPSFDVAGAFTGAVA